MVLNDGNCPADATWVAAADAGYDLIYIGHMAVI
jgi:hypothetical protein